jgi:putative nucleotidyltransferase with HDIG domain
VDELAGLNIVDSGQSLDRAEKRSTELRLVGKAASLELMHQRIRKGSLFGLSPAASGMPEAFYVLSGECVYQSPEGQELRRLSSGACVTAVDLGSNAYFRSLTELELLYVSTQPVFASLSDQIAELVAISREVEGKDAYTAMHCERLQRYSVQIAERLGLSPNRIENLIHAAILHDVGKSAVPSEILNKPGPLTPEETKVMRGHALLGAQMVGRTYLKAVAQIIAQHHEWHNGKGYPNGTAWPELTLEAAIIACVDAYDAMTSDRPYRRAMAADSAAHELRAGRGSQFHPDVVDALLTILAEEGVLATLPPRPRSEGAIASISRIAVLA